MLKFSIKALGLSVVVAIALGVTAPNGHSEIAIADLKTGAKAKTSRTTKAKASPAASNWVQCWQHGVKIIDEKEIFDIRLQKLTAEDNFGFRGQDSKRGNVFVVPLNGDSTCLIKPQR